MSHTGHTCIHWTTNLTSLCPSLDEEVTCSRLQDFPDLWVRCRAAEVKMEGPDSQPPQISSPLPPPIIAEEAPHQPSPPPQTSPTSPLQSLPHTPLRHSPLPHTPITPHTPLPHTPLTPHSPLTPLTSQSTLASEASVDSGVASAHSLDMLHNSCSSFETHALRRRAGSSVSSGTSEGWLGSLDGDPAGLEVLPELWPHSESPTAPGHSLPPSHNSPASPKHSPTPSHRSPTLSCHSPVTMHHSPTTTTATTTTTTTTATTQNHLPPSSEAAISKAIVPGDSQDPERHSSSPRDNPKEAFSTVIPIHPSALSPHTSPLRPGVVQTGKKRQNFMITVNSAPITESQCGHVFTEYGCSGDEGYYENRFCFTKDHLLLQENCGLNGVLRKTKTAHHLATFSEANQIARECIWIDKFASLFVKHIIEEALSVSSCRGWSIKCSGQCQREQCRQEYQKKENTLWSVGGGKGNRKSSIPILGLSCGSPGLCWTPELPYSPSHRPHSRSSLGSSLSFSHDSLVSSGPRMDDSHLITGAVSHDALLFPTSKASHSRDVGEIYHVPLEGDIYAVPVDVVKPKEGQIIHPKAIMHHPKKRHHRKHPKTSPIVSATLLHDSNSKKVSSFDPVLSTRPVKDGSVSRSRQHSGQSVTSVSGDLLKASKRHSVPSNIGCALSMTPKHNSSKENHEPIHMTLEEVRKSFHESDDTINCNKSNRDQESNKGMNEHSKICRIIPFTAMKSCKRKDSSENRLDDNRKKGRSISSNIRNTLITIFGLKKGTKSSGTRLKSSNCVDAASQGFSEVTGNGTATLVCSPTSGPQHNHTTNPASNTVTRNHQNNNQNHHSNPRHSNGINTGLLSCLGNLRAETEEQPVSAPSIPTQTVAPSRSPAIVTNRALPPLPLPASPENEDSPKTPDGEAGAERREEEGCDFASIIEKVKDCGWYWGPISGEAAEKVLANEPDGSFIVRDSSDHHYIFSLTFKLNGFIRHVRIEHDQGNFSFGGFTKFKSQTIVEFIENAVEHSRSGRYLFFLHRRPVLGPMRVQLLHPVSRFKHIQSLQHLCRFVIVKHVRRDLISELPLPQRLKDYLCSPHYYSERVEQCMAAAAAAASDNDDSASSGATDEGNGVPSQVLHPSLGELDNNLPVLPGLMPSFPGVPQPVMDRASQTSQATSPNPPLATQDQPHDNIHTCSLQETDSTPTVSSTLQDADHLTSSTAQSFSEPNHQAVIPPVRVDDYSRTATTTYSPTCCSPAHVEPETYPACSQVTQTSQAHTASASPAPQGNLAFAHQHTTSASGRLSLISSTSDVQDNTSSLNDRTVTLSESSPSDADRIVANAATVSREYFRINPCRGLDDHVFEDLGGV